MRSAEAGRDYALGGWRGASEPRWRRADRTKSRADRTKKLNLRALSRTTSRAHCNPCSPGWYCIDECQQCDPAVAKFASVAELAAFPR